MDPFGRFLGARMLARNEAMGGDDYLGELIFALTTDLLPARVLEVIASFGSVHDWTIRATARTRGA